MSGSKNTSAEVKKQAAPNLNLAYETEAKILSHLRMAIRYADLADQHYEIFDNFGFDRCVEQFVAHANDISTLQKKLRSLKGVTE